MGPHSFDPPRDRGAPIALCGRWRGGDDAVVLLRNPTLIIAVKPNCDGCRDLLESTLDEFDNVHVLFVSADDEGFEEWEAIRHPILVSAEILRELDIRWPPFYVLVDATSAHVLTEGVVFGASQIANEISGFLQH